MSSLNRLSATAAARKLATREITAVALLEDCLDRIAAREPTVHAWTFLDTDAAMRRARELDAQGSAGLLHGLPIAVKDLFDTCDMPSSYGSPIYANHRPAADAACVALARAAGAIVVGKTVTTEFATFHPGPTCNPHNPLHTPGGSSSGSAAAVADWMVPLAFGTQTAGSIVRPAAYCGVVGYKPTFGTVNRVGVKMISDTLDTVGALARSVPDVALFVAALADRPELMIERPLGRSPRVGLCRTHEWDRAHPETVTAFEDAARCLREAGASVRDVVLPPQFAELVDAQIAIMVHEVARSLSYERLVHRDKPERRNDRHDRRGPCGIAGALRRRPGIGAKKSLDAGRGFCRRRRLACTEHRRRGAARDCSDRRSAVQSNVDAAAHALRASPVRIWAAGIAGRHHASWGRLAAIVRCCWPQTGFMRGLVDPTPQLRHRKGDR